MDKSILADKISCDYCDLDTTFSNHKILESHRLTHEEYRRSTLISDDMQDFCKTKCEICEKIFCLSDMRFHVKKEHGIIITDYKRLHGYKIIDLIHHKCKLCGQIIIFDE